MGSTAKDLVLISRGTMMITEFGIALELSDNTLYAGQLTTGEPKTRGHIGRRFSSAGTNSMLRVNEPAEKGFPKRGYGGSSARTSETFVISGSSYAPD